MATAIPEVHTLGGDDVVVVAGDPGAAGARRTRQSANGALAWREERTVAATSCTVAIDDVTCQRTSAPVLLL